MPRKSKTHAVPRPVVPAEGISPIANAPLALVSEAPLLPLLAAARLTPLQIALLSRGQVRAYSPLDD